jgi:segregation and condensation protein A
MIKNDLENNKIEQLTNYVQQLSVKVRDEEVDLGGISLLEIIEQYLAYMILLRPENVDLDVVADFLVAISALIFWKSNLLLPGQQKEPDEDIQDNTDDLRLKEEYWREYKRYQSLINIFENKAIRQGDIYLTYLNSKVESEDQYQKNHFPELILALESILSKRKTQNTIHIKKRKYNITDKIKEIEHKFRQKQGKLSFQNIISDNCSKIEIIIIFLALLEMICQGKVNYNQSKNFGNITFYRKEDRKLKK